MSAAMVVKEVSVLVVQDRGWHCWLDVDQAVEAGQHKSLVDELETPQPSEQDDSVLRQSLVVEEEIAGPGQRP